MLKIKNIFAILVFLSTSSFAPSTAHALTEYGKQLALGMCPNRAPLCVQNAITRIQNECNQKLELINQAKISDRQRLARTCSNYQKVIKICGRDVVKTARGHQLQNQHNQSLQGIKKDRLESIVNLTRIINDFAYSTAADLDKTQMVRGSKIAVDTFTKATFSDQPIKDAFRDSLAKNIPAPRMGTIGKAQNAIEFHQALKKFNKAWNTELPPKRFHTQK
ncbi:hypothetical protein [Maridesulfovibrio salexigens]|uniref:Uncharacterized protein n=1 Tax=Maridesulfovibrio salexigens (strain ATCC 14822 / DSM 2638 / NCIMB 8403 / VKM B-1763) TaxID=526222 RepID=C6C087_MARSD|nr:hypothetical protein [Maridesulfovibrio salexigens]ACS80958.1 hypothetical protein Desal_2906 [Maridesulfovibrio salexigens DSM 2638]